MKKLKQCEFCSKKFRNRENMVNHLWGVHGFWYKVRHIQPSTALGYPNLVLTKEKKSLLRHNESAPVIKTTREPKPHRRIRMAMYSAFKQKEETVTNHKRIGRSRTGKELPLIITVPAKSRYWRRNLMKLRRTRMKGK